MTETLVWPSNVGKQSCDPVAGWLMDASKAAKAERRMPRLLGALNFSGP
jgi:hypothetical protein